jgi:hypothetical protein
MIMTSQTVKILTLLKRRVNTENSAEKRYADEMTLAAAAGPVPF